MGQLVVLRPFRPADVAAMARILADPEVVRLTGSDHTTAQAHDVSHDSDRIRQWYATRAGTSGDRLDLAIVDRSTWQTVGEVVLNEWDSWVHETHRVWRWLARRDVGRGAGVVALRLDD